MTPIFVLYAALINWFATFVLVESTLFAPWRDFCVKKGQRILLDGVVYRLPFTFPSGTDPANPPTYEIIFKGPWFKVGQLVTCHTCTGVWVGFIEAIVLGGPFSLRWGILTVIANGLLFKAGGHLILELRAVTKLFEPRPQEYPNAQGPAHHAD